MRRLLLLCVVLGAAAAARAAEPKTDIEAPKAQGSAVGTNTNMSDADAAQRLQGHHIRDTHRVKIGATDAAPNKPGQPSPPGQASPPPQQAAGGAGSMQSAAGSPGGDPGLSPGAPQRGSAVEGPVTDATLNDQAKVMLGGTPTDFRTARQQAVAGVGQAANSWNLGDYKNVVLETNRALKADPRNFEALSLQALAYERLRDFSDSEADLRRAVAISSGDVRNWEHLAWAAFKQGKAQDALEAAQAALARDPQDAAALAIRAYAEDALGKREDAAQDIQAAARIDPAFASRAERAKSGDRLCAFEEELVDPRAGGGGRRKAGLPTWLPWVGGAMLCGLGLTFVLIGQLKASESPAAEAAPVPAPTEPPKPAA